MIVSDSESNSKEEWAKNVFLPALEGYKNISSITVQLEDPQRISEVTNLCLDKDFFYLIIFQINLYQY